MNIHSQEPAKLFLKGTLKGTIAQIKKQRKVKIEKAIAQNECSSFRSRGSIQFHSHPFHSLEFCK